MHLRPTFAPVLVLSAASFLMATSTVSTQPSDLTVHEWGTFTSVAGEDGSAIDWDALGCKDDLPGFVNDFGYRGFKWRLTGTVRMETPVMYFYSLRELDAHVKVAFAWKESQVFDEVLARAVTEDLLLTGVAQKHAPVVARLDLPKLFEVNNLHTRSRCQLSA